MTDDLRIAILDDWHDTVRTLPCFRMLSGHDVTIFEARDKLGGLDEYGIAAYKTVNDFAQREVDWLLKIGGITPKNKTALGREGVIWRYGTSRRMVSV